MTVLALALLIAGWQGGAPERAPADTLMQQGAAAMQSGDHARAEALFRRALAADPRSSDAHVYLGVLADQAGRLSDAERHFATAVALAPNSPAARNDHGAVLVKLGRSVDAAAEFEASLRLDANQPACLVNLGQIRAAEGSPKALTAAQELFRRALTLAPDAQVARALLVVALRRQDKPMVPPAYAEYARLQSLQTGTAAERVELGQALLHAGFVPEAASELKAAIAAGARDPRVLVETAKAYEGLKDYPAAGQILESAVASGVHDASVYAALADVYEATGHLDHAIPVMKLAVDTAPQSEQILFEYGLMRLLHRP